MGSEVDEPRAPERAPILVTGMTRSGTTWLGKVLAASGEVTYINEPLNPVHPPGGSPGILGIPPVAHRWQYICDDNESEFLEPYRELLRLRYHLWRELRRNHAPSDLPQVARDLVNLGLGRVRRRRALIKDPYAAFSTDWFQRRLGCHVVVAMRHPAAVVSSFKRLGWRGTDVHELLDQSLLMRDLLGSRRPAMEAMLERGEDVVEQQSQLWHAIYGSLADGPQRTSEPLIVRHEDLSLNPVAEFERLYRALHLPFTSRVKEAIERSTTADASELEVAHPHGFRLDSRANLGNWKRRLTADEIARIRSITSDVATRYYPDSDW